MIVSRLRHYVAEHQQDRDSYVVPLTYAYSMQVYLAAKIPPFSIKLSRQLPGPVTPTASPMPPDVEHVSSTMALSNHLIRRATELKLMVGTNLY